MPPIGVSASLLGFIPSWERLRSFPGIPNDRRTAAVCLPPGPRRNWANAVPLNASLAASSCSFTRLCPPLSGWSTIARQVALTYTATIIVALAAQQADRPDLIRSPKRVSSYLGEFSNLTFLPSSHTAPSLLYFY